MTEYTARELKNVTRLALRQLADDRHQGPQTRAMALGALADLNDEPKPDLREPYIYRVNVQPGLWLTVDASRNIMLEVRTPDEAELLAAYALSDTGGVAARLELCRIARDKAADDAEAERVRQLNDKLNPSRWSEPRDGEDDASRASALAELAAAGLNEHAAQLVLKRAYYHLSGSFSVSGTDSLGTATYDREDGTYHVRLPETDELAEVNEAFAELRRLEDRRDAVRGLTAREPE